jgi:hypothetical protein
MSFLSTVKRLMGTGYDEIPAAPAPVETAQLVVRQVPYEPVVPQLQLEEQAITALRRQALHEYAPVMSVQDPSVRQAGFRNRFDPARVKSEAVKQARARVELEADAPVAPRSAPLVTSSAMEIAEQRSLRHADQFVPVLRRVAA